MKKKSSNFGKYAVVIIASLWVVVAVSCFNEEEKLIDKPIEKYWAHSDTVSYVGIQTCAGCHVDIYNTFTETGMGKSFGWANKTKSAADFEKHHKLKDEHTGLQYHVFWKNDSLYVKEFFLDKQDTLHQLTLKADYIIGSGQHTNSHLMQVNGYLYQMPFTFYTQEQKLDLPPGFEEGANSRFSRIIGLECMSCHNAMPTEFVLGSDNQFNQIPMGIDCERCHGPGSAHVAKIGRGEITDTSKHIDYSIVNPKKLEPQLRFEICQRCHLQGNTVLAEGKSFFDFKPGMKLSEVMDVYLPQYEGDHGFIMASHADRLKQSKCYTLSNKQMDCTTCHNPHKSVKKTDTELFNISCKNCHQGPQNDCKEKESILENKNFNCVECHMPLTGAQDIPHVSIHDHKIAVHKKKTEEELSQIKKFIGLKAINQEQPSLRSKIRAYLNQYEKFEAEKVYLDSLEMLFALLPSETGFLSEKINYFFLIQDIQGFKTFLNRNGIDLIYNKLNSVSYDNDDAWTSYKCGNLLEMSGDLQNALKFYNKAIQLSPKIPSFKLKAGNILTKMQRFQEAQVIYKLALSENPLDYELAGNLGFAYMMSGDLIEAKEYLDKALKNNILYKNAHLNMIQYLLGTENYGQAKLQTQKAKKLFPNDEKVQMAWEYLQSVK